MALQLAVRYATKSGKMSLAQKITDELIEKKKEEEEKEKEMPRSVSPPAAVPRPLSTSSTITFTSSSAFEPPIKRNQPKVSTSNGPFNNPFRKLKNPANPSDDTSNNDELSKWKPSINKSRLATSNKTTPQVRIQSSPCLLRFEFVINLERCSTTDELGK